MPNKEVCDYCDKRGVPILPLRYAVAPAGAGLPTATGPEVALDAQAAHYTRRLLRSGYLYVYDEARKRWEDYFVTADGYFFRLHSSPGVPPVLPDKPFNCPDVGHGAVASCITIPDAKRATKVWLGFSDVQWTEAVRKLHASAAYRARHMRCVNVNAYAGSPDKAHCLPLAKVASDVTEYKMDAVELNKRLAFSPFAPNSRLGKAEELVKQAERLAPGKGFAVVLDDPAGVAQELATLMKRNHDLFVNHPDRKYGVAVDGVLTQVELAIKQEGERARMMEAQRDAVNFTNPGYMAAGDGGSGAAGGMALARWLSPGLNKDLEEIEENIRNVPRPELDAAANRAWSKYAKKLKGSEREQWRKAFDAQLKDYDARFIAPLAQSHAALLEHSSLLAQFECNFDSNDMRSGAAYTAVLANCTSATGDKKACFDLYVKWLGGKVTDTKNLLLRALAYNQDPTAKEVSAAVSGSTDWNGLPWDKVIEATDKATATLTDGAPDALGRLVGNITGAVAKLLQLAVDESRVVHGLVLLAARARQPIVEVQIDGSRKAFRSLLIRQLFRLSGQNVPPRQMERAVAEELRRLRMHGVPLDGTERKRWLLMIDPSEVKAMPQGLGAQARAQWLAGRIRTPQQVDELHLDRFLTRLGNGVRGGAPFVFALLGVLANWKALDSTRDSERKALAHGKSEGLARVCAQGAQLVGAIAATLETALSRLPAFSSAVARGVQNVSGRLIGILGKVLGVGGSLFMAGIDFYRASQEWKEGNKLGAALFVVSGAAGVAATLLLFFGATGVGLVVVVFMIALAFVMTALVDNSLQDWMERCRWGILTDQRYRDFDKEMAELKAATQG